MPTDDHNHVPGVNGSIRGRGIPYRKLSEAQRADLADRACSGKLDVSNLSAKQACTIFGITVACMVRHRNAHASGGAPMT